MLDRIKQEQAQRLEGSWDVISDSASSCAQLKYPLTFPSRDGVPLYQFREQLVEEDQ